MRQAADWLAMTPLTEQSVHQYAQALVYMHGRQAPYFAAMHALARRESSEHEAWRLWLAVGDATARLISVKSDQRLH